MGKFQLRKPKIISKNFPEVGSHIDNVSKSLHDLVFTYSAQVDRALQKKHMMMALSSLVLILVVGNFISPKGKADIATFYPETCLGGWINPRNAEKEPETTSNADPSQFNDKNSAILDKNTKADIYCGNFSGTFNDATQPTKIIVSFALTNKGEITTVQATDTPMVSDLATTTSPDSSSTSTDDLLLASTSTDATSSETNSFSTTSATEAQSSPEADNNSGSIVDSIVGSVGEAISNIFNKGTLQGGETDTVVVPQTPPPAPSVDPSSESVPVVVPETHDPLPSESPAPTSYRDMFLEILSTSFASKVFAEEVITTVDSAQETIQHVSLPVTSSTESTESEPLQVVASTSISETESVSSITGTSSREELNTPTIEGGLSSTTLEFSTTTSTSTDQEFIFATTTASSTMFEDSTATTTALDKALDSQNNFLEILYTFDGVTWVSLGELNEISMKYRTFEIPLSASSTWSDLSQLQIKVASKSVQGETPVVYLDGVKVEVLYNSTLEYSHPDFVRDTILKDETVDGVRLVTIINNETNEEETWYMYLDEEATSTVIIATTTTATTTEEGTSTLIVEGSTTDVVAAITNENQSTSTLESITDATSSEPVNATTSTSTPTIVPVIQKNKWFKLIKKEEWASLSARELVDEIKKLDQKKLEQKVKEDRLPDFAIDVIKKMKGTLLDVVVVQVEKEGEQELWLYGMSDNKIQKVETGSSTSISIDDDAGIGVKDESLFWVTNDKKQVVAYNLVTKALQAKDIPPYDASLGERGRVVFGDVPWEVIVDSDKLTFYSEATGEVFSDDNGSLVEVMRQKFELDKLLDIDEISNLNLPVTESIDKESN